MPPSLRPFKKGCYRRLGPHVQNKATRPGVCLHADPATIRTRIISLPPFLVIAPRSMVAKMLVACVLVGAESFLRSEIICTRTIGGRRPRGLVRAWLAHTPALPLMQGRANNIASPGQ